MDQVSKTTASGVQASFRELAKTASQINTVSDALGKYIAEIESGLKALNLGVGAWVTFHQWDSSDGLIQSFHQLGYDKIGKNWCIGIRVYDEAAWSDEWTNSEKWAFDEAPRQLRIDAVDDLPILIQKLNVEASKLAKKLAAKLPTACDVASEVKAAVDADKNVAAGKTK